MKSSRKKEILDFLKNGKYDLEIKLEHYESLVQLLDDFDNRNKSKEVAAVSKKTIEDRRLEFAETLSHHINKETKNGVVTRDDAVEFYHYWTEASKNQKKMRFEKEKAFDTGRRVGTWMSNKLKFAKSGDKRESIDDVYNNILNFNPNEDNLRIE